MNVFELMALPVRLSATAVEVSLAASRFVASDGPLRRPGGYAERLEDLLADDGMIVRLLEPGGTLERLLEPGGTLERILEPGGVLDRFTEPGGTLDELMSAAASLERLTAPGGTLDQLSDLMAMLPKLANSAEALPILAGAVSQLEPTLAGLRMGVGALQDTAKVLGQAVEPMGRFVERLPGGKRRPLISGPKVIEAEQGVLPVMEEE
jgi:hypothetical protein